MIQTNKNGLKRNIGEKKTLAIRQRDKFACVICGSQIITYEHFKPEFKDATSHKVEGMALLCPNHQQMATGKSLSKETIAKATLDPDFKRRGYNGAFFDVEEPLEIILGSITFLGLGNLICINGETVLSLDINPEFGHLEISGVFKDREANNILEIKKNVWNGDSNVWDFKQKGPVMTIRRGSRDISLKIRSKPPHKIIIERFDNFHNGYRYNNNSSGKFEVTTPEGTCIEFNNKIRTKGKMVLENDSFKIEGEAEIAPGTFNISHLE